MPFAPVAPVGPATSLLPVGPVGPATSLLPVGPVGPTTVLSAPVGPVYPVPKSVGSIQATEFPLTTVKTFPTEPIGGN